MPPIKSSNKRSISQDLTVSLVFAILVISTLVISWNYWSALRREKNLLTEKADEYLNVLVATLEIPLWDMDRENIRNTGIYYASHELIAELKITDAEGVLLFFKTKKAKQDLIERSAPIYHDQELIGRVDLSFSTGILREKIKDLLWSSVLTIFFVVLSVTILTGILLRSYLKKPLKLLSEKVRHYAAGRYTSDLQPVEYTEFEQFFLVLSAMSEKINAQMTELRQAEEKYRNIFENAMEGIFQSTIDGRFISANPALARIHGYESPEELMAGIADIATQVYDHPHQREEFMSLMRRQDMVEGFQIEVRRRNGELAVISLNARTVRDTEGKILYFEGTVEDITEQQRAAEALQEAHHKLEVRVRERTAELQAANQALQREISERKRIEEALRASEERYRTIFEQSRDAIYITSPQGWIIDINQAGSDILGYSREEFKKLNVSTQYSAPENRRAATEELERIGYIKDREIVLQHKNGREIICLDTAVLWRDKQGEILGYVGTLRDVTERKKTEEEARKAQALLLAAIEQTPAGILIADAPDVTIRLANATALGITGASTEPLTDIPLDLHPKHWQTFHPDGTPFAPQDLPLSRAVLEGITSQDVKLVIRQTSGQERWVSANAAPVRNEEGEIIAGIVVFLDITEQMRAEADKQRLELQLRHSQKMEAIGTLASGVAHDFNNILQAISGYIQLIAATPDLQPKTLNYALEIDRAAQRAADLVQRLLTFSRKLEPELKSINLNQEVLQAVGMLERTIPKMIAINTYLSEELSLISADVIQLNQVLMNLGANARDAMPDGGRIVIGTENVHLDQAYCREHPEAEPGQYVLLKVSDTGQGIDQDTLKNIFDPFFTTKEIGKGTGLGLSMVYGIVKGHGGHVTCYSHPGQGTTFSLYFPVLPDKSLPPSREGRSEEEVPEGDETILLVDDDEAIIDLIRETLSDNGYTVLTAASGEQALDIYRDQGQIVDLVILDLGMPGMGGRGCLKELITIDPQVKVIVASGYSADGQIKDTLKCGAKAFLNKPYRLTVMLNQIRQVLGED